MLTNDIHNLDTYSRVIVYFGGIVLYTRSPRLTHVLICDDIPSRNDYLGYSRFSHSNLERVHPVFTLFLNLRSLLAYNQNNL